MSNLRIEAPLVDGSLMPYVSPGDRCSTAVNFVTGDDLRPPARSLNITVQTKAGKTVEIVIPNDASAGSFARARIDGQEI